MIKPRVVFDTNIYLSALFFSGTPEEVFRLAIQDKINLFVSPSIILEIAQKLKNKFLWPDLKIQEIIKIITDTAFVIRPIIKIDIVNKDKGDNKILEAALLAKARFIITGDKHLLEIKQYKNIRIIKAREFLNLFPKALK